MRVAVNHPYFFPYAGYYRLMAQADVMVLFDCVQFPRRGYVHRNQLVDQQGRLAWFSLALKKRERNVLIREIQFTDDIEAQVEKNIRRFPILMQHCEHQLVTPLLSLRPHDSPCEYLCESLEQVKNMFDFNCRLLRSSSLDIAPDLKGEDRVLAILESLGATHYINAPSGKRLYSEHKFSDKGISLKFLQAYPDNKIKYRSSMLQRLLNEDISEIRQEIEAESLWQR